MRAEYGHFSALERLSSSLEEVLPTVLLVLKFARCPFSG